MTLALTPRGRLATGLLLRVASLATLATLATTAAAAQTVSGHVLRWRGAGAYPAGSLAVTLYSPQRGRSATVYTSQDGSYVFYNVPAGSYALEIWVGRNPVTAPVRVDNRPVNELPPYTLR